MLTNEQIEAIVAQYDRSVAGDDAAIRYGVSERTDVGEGAELVQVLYGDDKQWTDSTAVVVYDTGDVFCLDDWTLGPIDRDGIADYQWVHAQSGRKAVILDGLPRLPDQLPDTLPDIVKGLFEGGNFPNAKINILTDDNAVVSYHE